MPRSITLFLSFANNILQWQHHPISPLLLSVQGLGSCCCIGDASLDGQLSRSLYTILLKRHGERQKGGMKNKENNRQPSGRRLTATILLVETERRGQKRGPHRSIPTASRLSKRLTGAIVPMESRLGHRCSTCLPSRCIVCRFIEGWNQLK